MDKQMLIQQKREREFARYKGLAIRTIIQTIWLIISAFVAYYFLQYIINIGVFSIGMLRAQLPNPPWLQWLHIPDWLIMAVLILMFVIVMQFFLVLGFIVFKPLGRTRPGNPSMRKSVDDPLEDNQYSHR